MSLTKTYSLTEMEQLIDLNGDLKNFQLRFHVRSQDNTPFNAVVIDQTTLDSDPVRKFTVAPGEYSGNLSFDQDIYQNYFLALKAKDKPCKVDVLIDRQEIPPQERPLPQRISQSPVSQSSMALGKIGNADRQPSVNWKIVILAVVILGGGALLFYFYLQEKKKKSSKSLFEGGMLPPSTTVAPVASFAPVASPRPSPPAISPEASAPIDSSLLARLNKLPFR